MSTQRARRKNGVCYGTLWKQHSAVTSPPSLTQYKQLVDVDRSSVDFYTAALERNERGKTCEFCVLIGNIMTCYENMNAFRKGDAPTAELEIVGASAWNPPPVASYQKDHSRSLSPSEHTHKLGHSPTFRLLTQAGTHLFCTTQTVADRDIWLSALHSGMEIAYAGYEDTLMTLKKLAKGTSLDDGDDDEIDDQVEVPTPPRPPKSLVLHDHHTEPSIMTPPVPDRSSNVSSSPRSILSPANAHNTPFQNPYEIDQGPTSKSHCLSCGRFPPENAIKSTTGSPLFQYGIENKVSICQPCLIAQGVLRDIMLMKGLYACDAHERVAIMRGKVIANEILKNAAKVNGDGFKPVLNYEEGMEILSVRSNEYSGKLEDIVMTPEINTAIMQMTSDARFAACRRRSSVLDGISTKLDNGEIGTAEFVELLSELARDALTSSSVQTESISMKKEALMVSGDMRAAIQMLYENALPASNENSSLGKTEMLSCALEFFLDLCEQGELSAVSFFWPQICHIHLQMLPVTDSESLMRIELVEDFLLTVSVRYSVHLALELVWGCLADLEDSLRPSVATSDTCKMRRFSLIRFLCELESLIFDFDGGWGTGGCSLRDVFSPSEDQSSLIKTSFGLLQMHRTCSSHHLSRSVRIEKLSREMEIDKLDRLSDVMDESIDEAKRKYYIARGAEYFSTQLMFCRRLGDIAEILRFTELENRASTLESELEILNSSGRLGGDPLNSICLKGEYKNVMNIPTSEGHVFRSKERTPILLLMETVLEHNILSSGDIDEKGTCNDRYPINNCGVDDSCMILSENNISPKGKLNGILRSPKSHNSTAIISVGSMEEVADLVEIKLKLQIPNISVDVNESGNDPNISERESIAPEELDHHINSIEGSPVEEETHNCEASDDGMFDVNIDNHVSESTSDDRMGQSDMQFEDCNVYLDAASRNKKSISDETLQIDEAVSIVPKERSHSNQVPFFKNFADAKPIQLPEREKGVESSGIFRPSFQNSDSIHRSASFSKKVSAFGALCLNDNGNSSQTNLSLHGEGRREVLTTIFTKGMRSSNVIARGAAPAARRAIQAMDRKRAQLLLGTQSIGDEEDLSYHKSSSCDSAYSNQTDELQYSKTSEEDECIESIRLLLVQNSVALGKISIEKAADVLHKGSETKVKKNRFTTAVHGDPGIIDPRLAGCGTVSEAVISALKLWTEGLVSNGELLDLVQKDLYYTKLALPGADNESKLMEDSAFWGRFAFGERWAEKKARIQASSEFGSKDGWDLTGLIVKSNDDLRQEAFAMQLIELSTQAFQIAGLELWTHPYRILATGRTTGIIEMVRNAMSFDSLKKRPGYSEGGNLLGHFKKMAEFAADPVEALKLSKKNFVSSLAAYSLLSYFFEFKDRHNGNLLLDTAGHVIHIDFGFIFGIAPGGSFSLEQGIPFKLTEEMIKVMDGLGSPLFSEFVTLFCCGFLAMQEHCDTFLTIVDLTCQGSTFKCFEGKEAKEIVSKLKERFRPDLSKDETITHAMELIRLSCNATGTTQYDFFQYMSQGIAT